MAVSEANVESMLRRRTTVVSIAAAGALVALKLGVGLLAGSLALVSAGIESSGDVLAAMMTFFIVRLSGRPADSGHPYGHGRAEHLGALAEAAILLAGVIVLVGEAIARLVSPHGAPDTNWYVFAVIGVALVVDLARTTASFHAAGRLGSPALRSNAFHFAGDMVGSIAVLVGLLLVRAGFDQGDAAAALVIAGIILATAVRLIAENANVLMDRTPAQARRAAEDALALLPDEIEVVRLRLRESAGRYFADVIATIPPGEAVVEGQKAARLIEQSIEDVLPGADVVVEVRPRRHGLDLRDGVLAAALGEPLVKEVHDITLYEHGGGVEVSMHLKFPTDLALKEALAAAQRIERGIEARPGVLHVQTHIEPLELSLPVELAGAAENEAVAQQAELIAGSRAAGRVVRARALRASHGLIVFVTLLVADGMSLDDAHRLSGEVEEDLRRELANIADVVVHTAVVDR